ncbi:ABC transporter ATP-binding protein [Alicyclobacillus dauci]|uniref:ABC transporter ATP-binding protein n=1 Tax=Alicyclobacillus dauci TaxID=1475485 RepID=A0ABY6Z8W5_9BACL|nr:ABC transporter ATP-binding protein [Alicyclobacillus dauci]WAH39178.1 ABC transporter ATP-binding protein [Alicyclobacillus dauci]
MLSLKSITQSPILSAISADFEPGRMVGIIGPNGAGKSTLLRTIAGLLMPTAGEVWVDGQLITRMAPKKRARYVAYLPQSLAQDVPYSVREFVEMGRFSHRSAWSPTDAHDASAITLALRQMGLESLSDAPLSQVSGGEQQRTGIARCLAQESPVLLLDEPISNLDVFYQLDIMSKLASLARKGHLILVAIHHLEFALRFCNELLVMCQGEVYAQGSVKSTFTPQLIRDVFCVDATMYSDPIQHHPRLSMTLCPEKQEEILPATVTVR